MKLTSNELEFLSTWAREEWEPACYGLPAHRLQLAHDVAGHQLTSLIKAWAVSEGRKDRDIIKAGDNSNPRWPWRSVEEFENRFSEAASHVHGFAWTWHPADWEDTVVE